MNRLLAPFLFIMKRLNYSRRFALIGLILLGFTVTAATVLVNGMNNDIARVQRELQDVNTHKLMHDISQNLQTHRIGSALLNARQDDELERRLTQTERLLEEQIHMLRQSPQCMQDGGTGLRSCGLLVLRWEELEQGGLPSDPYQLYVWHNAIAASLLLDMQHADFHSGLPKGKRYAAYEAIRPLLGELPLLFNQIDQMFTHTVTASVAQRVEPGSTLRLMLADAVLSDMLESAASTVNGALPADSPSRAHIAAFRLHAARFVDEAAGAVVAPNPVYPTMDEIVSLGRNAMDSGGQFYKGLVPYVESALNDRIADLQMKRLMLLIMTALVVLLALGLFAAFYSTVITTIRQLTATSAEIASGDWRARVKLDANDELKAVEIAYNKIAETFHDLVEEREESAEKIRRLAYFDALTGLPNRFLFDDRLAMALAQARRNGTQLAVIFIDLDNFKRVNDTLGHHTGDTLLAVVGERLSSCLRQSDTVARMGGDEFIIILPDVATEEDSEKVILKIMQQLGKPISLEGQEMFISASIGVSLFPRDADDARALIQQADRAMYEVKGEGKNSFKWYCGEFDEKSRNRLEMEAMIRKGVEQGQFEVHFQPIVDMDSGRVIAAEALARWRHPKEGLMPTDRFLDIAEETGLIVPIDFIMLEQACAEARRWSDAGNDWSVSINVSNRHLKRGHLLAHVQGILQLTGFRADRLILEFSENGLTIEEESALAMLSELRSLGIRIAIDHFGTGASSLVHLKNVPFDQMKIDREFVKDIPDGTKDTAITASLVTLAQKLSMQVVAVGVEHERQVACLRELQAGAGQGLLFGAPVPVGGWTAWL